MIGTNDWNAEAKGFRCSLLPVAIILRRPEV